MSFGVLLFAAFLLRFSTSQLIIVLLSILCFTAHKIHKSGASVSVGKRERHLTRRCNALTHLELKDSAASNKIQWRLPDNYPHSPLLERVLQFYPHENRFEQGSQGVIGL